MAEMQIRGSQIKDGVIRPDGTQAFTADQSMGSHKLTGVTDPANPQDAATKAYVDAVAAGLNFKAPVRLATTANHGLTGVTAIDGVTPVAGDRILVKSQTLGAANGIYVAAAGAWSRSTDADTSAEVLAGLFVFVTEGTANGDKGFVLSTDNPIVLGTTVLVFVQFSGGGGGTGDIKSDGTVPFAADESMGGFKLTNVGAPVSGGDAANKTYVDTEDLTFIKKDGTRAFTADQSMGSHRLTNVTNPSSAQDAATKTYVDTEDATFIKKDGTRAFTADQSMGSHKLTSVTDPTSAQDAATKAYVDAHYTGEFTTTTTGNIDDLDFSNAAIIRMNNATLATIRGLKAGTAGQRVTIVSIGAGQVDLSHQDTGDATAASRLVNFVTTFATPLAAGVGSSTYQYDGTTSRWRLIAHHQGAPITIAYSSGNFTSDAGTWTVDSGDQITLQYFMTGRLITIAVVIQHTSTSGAGISLQITLPFTATARTLNQVLHSSENSVGVDGYCLVNASTATLILRKASETNWANSTNNIDVYCTVQVWL